MASDTVQQIKEKLTIVDIVSPYVKLKRAGKSLQGLCPFHKEKTPSFNVSIERGTWHCFGCGEGGDGFSFIEKIEGVDFKGAMKMLADKAGVKIEYSSGVNKEELSKRDRMFEVMARACEWYAKNINGSTGFEYAKSRGLKEDTIKNWSLGFAPDAWRSLLEAFTGSGFTIQELLSAGLIKEADGKPGTYYDRFRNRLIFPIRDNSGRVLAFTGRALNKDDQAKYLNSPETDLYHKSEVLFGLNMAKDSIRSRDFTLLVEGQLDVLMSHQAGFTNAIALSGTALSEKHIALMKRYSDNLMLMLDADPAGFKATARSASLALRNGLRVKAARLPNGKDPADMVNSDPIEFKNRITNAKSIVEFFIAELSENQKDSHKLLRDIEEIVLPIIGEIQSQMEREHFINICARSLGLSGDSVRDSLKRVQRDMQNNKDKNINTSNFIKKTNEKTVSTRELRSLQLLAIIHAYPDTPLANRVKSEYCRITEALHLPTDVPQESVIFEMEKTFGENPELGSADELLFAFETAVIREAYQEAVESLRRAEIAGDDKKIVEAGDTCAKISSRLSSLGH